MQSALGPADVPPPPPDRLPLAAPRATAAGPLTGPVGRSIRPRWTAVVRRYFAGGIGLILMYSPVGNHGRTTLFNDVVAVAVGLALVVNALITPRTMYWTGDMVGLTGLVRRAYPLAKVVRVDRVSYLWPNPVTWRRHVAYVFRFRQGGHRLPFRTDAALWNFSAVADLLAAAEIPLVEIDPAQKDAATKDSDPTKGADPAKAAGRAGLPGQSAKSIRGIGRPRRKRR